MIVPLAEAQSRWPRLLEHLTDLRRRAVSCFAAALIGFAISWVWVEEIFALILVPLEAAAPVAGMGRINYRDLTEPFFTLVKTAVVSGLFLSAPVILHQIAGFALPALGNHGRRTRLYLVAGSTLSFFVGVAFCYGFVMPYGFGFLFRFSQGFDANPMLMMSEHYDLAVKLLLAFGVVFEMPVAAAVVASAGLISHRTLLDYWRLAFVGAFVCSAILTPPDIGTQLAMAIPLMVLYSVSSAAAYVVTTRRERRERAQE